MASRKRIGIFYGFDENWAGGLYYVLNIIKSLKFLDDHQLPFIVVFYKEEKLLHEIESIQYPYLEYKHIAYSPKKWDYYKTKLLGTRLRDYYASDEVTFVYPFNLGQPYVKGLRKLKKFYWIPDFQFKYYPQYFSKDALSQKEERIIEFIEQQLPIVFSSQDAKNDFFRFYPHANNVTQVLPFVSIMPDLSQFDAQEILKKFEITTPYFVCTNQFWKHKNHKVIFEALTILKHRGIKVQVVFTGKEYDYRHPEYFNEIKNFVAKNDLIAQVNFLGFIDRTDQLMLIKNAMSVVQPSLFEGWSTVVEDTKALNQFIILSNIGVHQEQIDTNCFFFDAKNAEDLADKIAMVWESGVNIKNINYNSAIKKFAEQFSALDQGFK